MKPARTRFFILTLAFAITQLSLASPVHADGDTQQELYLRYEANWGGVHVADFALSFVSTPETFENRFHLETRGLTRYFTNMSVTAVSRGRIVSEPFQNNTDLGKTYVAGHYHTEYTNTKHFRWVDITFPEAPEPAQATTGTSPILGREENWNPAEKGPEVLDKVEAEHLINVNDPITLIPQMMEIVRAHLSGGPKSGIARGFDGRRRFDMRITYFGPATRTINAVRHETYRVRIDPQPVAGFKERHKTLWNNAAYDFYLSRDGKFMPLQIVPVDHGPVLTLVGECPSECEIKAEEG